ncbi:MAG TPA: hypothetical protein VLO07_06660, partial [Thermoanaerobaculia bacterium]|nr:hypothetical protein [Thermoanaerobaculia bacterium]
LEFAVRDGVPYAIDFLNPAPDADPKSVGEENFQWVLEHAARWLIERVRQGAQPTTRFHWQEFLSREKPAPAALGDPKPRASGVADPLRPATPRPRT